MLAEVFGELEGEVFSVKEDKKLFKDKKSSTNAV